MSYIYTFIAGFIAGYIISIVLSERSAAAKKVATVIKYLFT